ncbi:hypothetical protein BD779DRAFT_1475827 [Infundibulicybe gibba]|nr:hypothetical protein BD779DRAFT_1475827 [Infundibulicybe gibba]
MWCTGYLGLTVATGFDVSLLDCGGRQMMYQYDSMAWNAPIHTYLRRERRPAPSGNPNLLDGLNSQGIHSIENILTVDTGVHQALDHLRIWLEKTDTPNEYTLRSVCDERWGHGILHPIVFCTDNPERSPIPSPDYIALHATCTKVVALSGWNTLG